MRQVTFADIRSEFALLTISIVRLEHGPVTYRFHVYSTGPGMLSEQSNATRRQLSRVIMGDPAQQCVLNKIKINGKIAFPFPSDTICRPGSLRRLTNNDAHEPFCGVFSFLPLGWWTSTSAHPHGIPIESFSRYFHGAAHRIRYEINHPTRRAHVAPS